jgi:hypothetical protein
VLSATTPFALRAVLRWLRRRSSRAVPATTAPHAQATALRAWADRLSDARCAAELRAAADRHEHRLAR